MLYSPQFLVDSSNLCDYHLTGFVICVAELATQLTNYYSCLNFWVS